MRELRKETENKNIIFSSSIVVHIIRNERTPKGDGKKKHIDICI